MNDSPDRQDWISPRDYFDALRDADLRALAALRTSDQHASEIKDRADQRARELVAANQAYKDEKANELRSQIERERGHYLTREEYSSEHRALEDKMDAQFKPLTDYVAAQSGPRNITTATIVTILTVALLFISVLVIYENGHHSQQQKPVVVTVTTSK